MKWVAGNWTRTYCRDFTSHCQLDCVLFSYFRGPNFIYISILNQNFTCIYSVFSTKGVQLDTLELAWLRPWSQRHSSSVTSGSHKSLLLQLFLQLIREKYFILNMNTDKRRISRMLNQKAEQMHLKVYMVFNTYRV